MAQTPVQHLICTWHKTPSTCRAEREEAIRLRLENEKLQQENAQLQELLGIVDPPAAPKQNTRPSNSGGLAPERGPECISAQMLRAGGGEGVRVTAANGLWADDDTGLRAAGGDRLRAGRDAGLRAAANGAALHHENLMRCRVAQLERQVCRTEAELQVKPTK